MSALEEQEAITALAVLIATHHRTPGHRPASNPDGDQTSDLSG